MRCNLWWGSYAGQYTLSSSLFANNHSHSPHSELAVVHALVWICPSSGSNMRSLMESNTPPPGPPSAPLLSMVWAPEHGAGADTYRLAARLTEAHARLRSAHGRAGTPAGTADAHSRSCTVEGMPRGVALPGPAKPPRSVTCGSEAKSEARPQ